MQKAQKLKNAKKQKQKTQKHKKAKTQKHNMEKRRNTFLRFCVFAFLRFLCVCIFAFCVFEFLRFLHFCVFCILLLRHFTTTTSLFCFGGGWRSESIMVIICYSACCHAMPSWTKLELWGRGTSSSPGQSATWDACISAQVGCTKKIYKDEIIAWYPPPK